MVGGAVRIWTGAGTDDHATSPGELYVEGDLEVDGNAYLGDNAVVDNITITGTLTQQGGWLQDGTFTVDFTSPTALLAHARPMWRRSSCLDWNCAMCCGTWRN